MYVWYIYHSHEILILFTIITLWLLWYTARYSAESWKLTTRDKLRDNHHNGGYCDMCICSDLQFGLS